MKVETVSITLSELQEAVADYCKKKAKVEPSDVVVTGFGDKTLIHIDLAPDATVSGSNFVQKAVL